MHPFLNLFSLSSGFRKKLFHLLATSFQARDQRESEALLISCSSIAIPLSLLPNRRIHLLPPPPPPFQVISLS